MQTLLRILLVSGLLFGNSNLETDLNQLNSHYNTLIEMQNWFTQQYNLLVTPLVLPEGQAASPQDLHPNQFTIQLERWQNALSGFSEVSALYDWIDSDFRADFRGHYQRFARGYPSAVMQLKSMIDQYMAGVHIHQLHRELVEISPAFHQLVSASESLAYTFSRFLRGKQQSLAQNDYIWQYSLVYPLRPYLLDEPEEDLVIPQQPVGLRIFIPHPKIPPAPTEEPLPVPELPEFDLKPYEHVPVFVHARLANPTAATFPYPQRARDEELEGRVKLRIHVDSRGDVSRVEVIESSGHRILDRAAMQGARDWKYVPATRDDQPVSDSVTQTVVFRLIK